MGDLDEAVFILTILVFHIQHEGLEPIQLCEDVKDLLLRVLDPCFIGFNLLVHLDVHQMMSIKTIIRKIYVSMGSMAKSRTPSNRCFQTLRPVAPGERIRLQSGRSMA